MIRATPCSSLTWLRFWAAGLVALALAACTAAPSLETAVPSPVGYPGPGTAFPTLPPPPAEAYPLPTEAAPPAPTAAPSAGPAEALVAQAVADVALRAAVDPGSVQVVEVTEQSWPDASLGCPQEGQLYAQVVTVGYRIVLEAGGQRYAYHTDRDKAVYCADDAT